MSVAAAVVEREACPPLPCLCRPRLVSPPLQLLRLGSLQEDFRLLSHPQASLKVVGRLLLLLLAALFVYAVLGRLLHRWALLQKIVHQNLTALLVLFVDVIDP